MKTRSYMTRIGAMLLLVATIFSTLMTPALAASTVKSMDCSGNKNGGISKYVYVKTSKENATVKLTMTKGQIVGILLGHLGYDVSDKGVATKNVYGSYEIKTFYWDGKNWVRENEPNDDAYNAKTKTVTLEKKNTYYKIEVYSWRATTVYQSYWRHGIVKKLNLSGETDKCYDNCYWKTLPKCTAKPGSGCTMYSSTPVSKK